MVQQTEVLTYTEASCHGEKKGLGGKWTDPSFPSTSAGDYRELTRVPLRGEECCGVGRASRDSAGFGAMEEGLISRGGRNLRLPLRI